MQNNYPIGHYETRHTDGTYERCSINIRDIVWYEQLHQAVIRLKQNRIKREAEMANLKGIHPHLLPMIAAAHAANKIANQDKEKQGLTGNLG